MDKNTVWEQLEEGCAKSNVDLVVSTDECKIMKIGDRTGEGLMTMYEVFPGVYLMYGDFHMEGYNAALQNADTLLAIEHCREGRLEMEGNDICYCLEQGDLLIDTCVHHEGNVRFPLKHYHGITIAFQSGYAEEALHKLMPSLEINLEQLAEKFCVHRQPYVIRADVSVENIFSQLYRLPKKSQQDYFRIKILELLVYLRDIDFERHKKDTVYFYKSQVEKIHGIHKLMTQNLTEHYTQEQLSRQFAIGITQMKIVFKSIYGQSMYQYLKTYRMNKAAELLITQEQLKVAEIAAACGYESLTKFGQAFKSQFGIPPLEYRKSNGRKEING